MLSASQVTESSAPLPTDFVPSLHLYMHFLPKVVPSAQSRIEYKKAIVIERGSIAGPVVQSRISANRGLNLTHCPLL
jgi:hypothetical protein